MDVVAGKEGVDAWGWVRGKEGVDAWSWVAGVEGVDAFDYWVDDSQGVAAAPLPEFFQEPFLILRFAWTIVCAHEPVSPSPREAAQPGLWNSPPHSTPLKG